MKRHFPKRLRKLLPLLAKARREKTKQEVQPGLGLADNREFWLHPTKGYRTRRI